MYSDQGILKKSVARVIEQKQADIVDYRYG